jgi:hypothetical protein
MELHIGFISPASDDNLRIITDEHQSLRERQAEETQTFDK